VWSASRSAAESSGGSPAAVPRAPMARRAVLRARVLEELTRLGSRGRRTAAAVQGPAALTDREREVAVLAAQGFTAKEIGERLFIGHRTVESHLAHCYAKLGISSRGELIRQADRLGSTGPSP